jgi:chemotaxis family two-component system response regulator Rcp1
MTLESLGRPIELLLVEDNYGDQLLMREACALAAKPINRAVAGNGEDALRMLKREGPDAARPLPDLILLDLNLPGMDGRDVLKAMKADPPLARIPVIVLTSSAAEIDVLKSYDLNANSYIVKPSDFDQLQQIVAAIESYWLTIVAHPNAVRVGPSFVS